MGLHFKLLPLQEALTRKKGMFVNILITEYVSK